MSSLLEHWPSNTALVVDDEPPVRVTVTSILSKIGFDVTESEGGLHALSLLQMKPCRDLLVTETEPLGVDGWKLAESFMMDCPLGRVVLMPDHADVDGLNAKSSGAWIWVPKPYLADMLVEAVHALGLAHPQRVILVVDDEPMVRNLVQIILVKAGHTVMGAVDGQDALELSRRYPGNIDLVVTDVKMPRLSGPELAEQIKQERPETRILFMSGHASGVLRDYATCPSFVEKPFAPKRLLDKVTELLNRSDPIGATAEM
jgi:DNA-binding NtrC family response regulator